MDNGRDPTKFREDWSRELVAFRYLASEGPAENRENNSELQAVVGPSMQPALDRGE